MYKAKSSSYYSSKHHAEEYADQHYSKPLSASKHAEHATEEYHKEYVTINPDTDKPDHEVIPVIHEELE